MARHHAQAVRQLGHDIVAVLAGPKSRGAASFARDFPAPRIFSDRAEFFRQLRSRELPLDALVLCTPWDVTENLALAALDAGLPLLAEKPLALSEAQARAIMGHPQRERLLVGYNRRFYDFIPELSRRIRTRAPYLVEILSAEPYTAIVAEHGVRIAPYLPHFYTAHLVDLAAHLLGPLECLSVRRLAEASGRSALATFRARASGCHVSLTVLMDCAQHSQLKLYFDDGVVVLNPVEKMTAYDGISKVTTDGKTSYQLDQRESVPTSDDLKPGILRQLQYFIDDFIVGSAPHPGAAAGIIDLTRLCDQLSRGEMPQ